MEIKREIAVENYENNFLNVNRLRFVNYRVNVEIVYSEDLMWTFN